MTWLLFTALLFAQADAAKLAMQQGRFTEAAKLYSGLARQYPNEPMLHYNVGLALYSAGRHAPALQELRMALKAQPANAQVNFIVGAALAKLGKGCEALPYLDKAQPQMGEMPEYLEQLAGAQLACGQHTNAAATYERLTRQEPLLARAWYGLGMSQLSQNHETQARDAFARLSTLPPSDELRRLERDIARGLWNAKRYAEAKDALLRVKAMGVSEATLEYELGDCIEKLEGPQAALPYYAKAAALDPRLFAARGALGRTLITLAKPKEAIVHLEAAARATGDKSLWAALASAYRAAGRPTEATAALRRAR